MIDLGRETGDSNEFALVSVLPLARLVHVGIEHFLCDDSHPLSFIKILSAWRRPASESSPFCLALKQGLLPSARSRPLSSGDTIRSKKVLGFQPNGPAPFFHSQFLHKQQSLGCGRYGNSHLLRRAANVGEELWNRRRCIAYRWVCPSFFEKGK